MDFPQFTPNDPQLDVILERHRQFSDETRAKLGANVIARLVAWLALTLAMGWAVVFDYISGLSGIYLVSPAPDPEHRSNVTAVVVLFFLSLLPLFWPKSARGLTAFGVVWAISGGWILYWTLHA